MSNDQALTTRPTELLPSADTLTSMMALAERIGDSGIAPNSDPSIILAQMLTGRELGVPAMAALRLVHFIPNKGKKGEPPAKGGKLSIASELMLALIQRDQGDDAMMVEETTDEIATYSYRRRNWPEGERRRLSYTLAEAKAAGLARVTDWKNSNWEVRPAVMLRARCVSAIARLAFADSILGMYTLDEAEEIAEREPVVAVVAQAAQPRLIERPNGKKADAVTGEIVESAAIGTPVNPKPAPKAPTAAETEALRKKVLALLTEDTEKFDEWRGRGGHAELWGVSYQRLCEMLGTLNARKAERDAAAAQPLTDAQDIELAIALSESHEGLDALQPGIAALDDKPTQDRLMALLDARWAELPITAGV